MLGFKHVLALIPYYLSTPGHGSIDGQWFNTFKKRVLEERESTLIAYYMHQLVIAA